jgi:hypothetical protein
MSRFQGWEYAFQAGTEMEGLQGLLIGDTTIPDTTGITPPAMLRSNTGIVQTRRYGMDFGCLTVLVLQHIAECAVEDAWRAIVECGGMLTQGPTAPTCLDTD